jgi:hypothetical protein
MGIGEEMSAENHPIYYGCHTCHAQPGQSCRFNRPGGPDSNTFHKARVTVVNNQHVSDFVNVKHAKVHGLDCIDSEGSLKGICKVCGQTIQRLKGIPNIIDFFVTTEKGE